LPSQPPSTTAIGHVALNVLTNYFNKAVGVAFGFPAVAA
jgi:hypothetical protein